MPRPELPTATQPDTPRAPGKPRSRFAGPVDGERQRAWGDDDPPRAQLRAGQEAAPVRVPWIAMLRQARRQRRLLAANPTIAIEVELLVRCRPRTAWLSATCPLRAGGLACKHRDRRGGDEVNPVHVMISPLNDAAHSCAEGSNGATTMASANNRDRAGTYARLDLQRPRATASARAGFRADSVEPGVRQAAAAVAASVGTGRPRQASRAPAARRLPRPVRPRWVRSVNSHHA